MPQTLSRPPLPPSRVMTLHPGEVPYYSFPAFDALPFVRHGFSTRLGGVSRGDCESMNLSYSRGDDPAAVRENFERFCGAIGVKAENVVVSAQEHHINLYNATAADRGRGVTRPKGYADVDGLLTDEPDVVLCTQYADCVPLFFLDPVRRVAATSHAGWKGTAARIGAVTVERMAADYGCRREDILAAVGPSIGPCCFEVDAPVWEVFAAMAEFAPDGAPACGREDGGGKYHVDLWEMNRRILCAAGVRPEKIAVTDLCTRCHPDVFWSHRATGGRRGNLGAFLSLTQR